MSDPPPPEVVDVVVSDAVDEVASVSSTVNLNTTSPDTDTGNVSFFQLFKYSNVTERLLLCLAVICSAITGTVLPIMIVLLGSGLGKIGGAEAGSEHTASAVVHPVVLKFVYLGIVSLFASYAAHSLWQLTGESQAKRIRKMYVQGILRQDISWFDEAKHGSLTTRLAADTQQIVDGISAKGGDAVFIISQFIAGFAVAFVKGWKLAFVSSAAVPSVFLITAAVSMLTRKAGKEAQDCYAHAGSIAEQALHGIRTVHAFNLQGRFAERYQQPLKRARTIVLANTFLMAIAIGAFMFSLYSVIALAFWYGSRLVIKGEMTGANVLVVFFAILLASMDLSELPDAHNAIRAARVAAYRIFEVIDRRPTIDALPYLGGGDEGERPASCEGRIEFKSVRFSYPSRKGEEVLKGFSLDIKPGSTVALVGASGCGESTCIGLIQRWYDIDAGEILLDNRPLDSLSVPWLRSQIGVVGQEPSLFNFTIRENVLMGLPPNIDPATISEEQLHDVCRMAYCHDFIMQLPQGYETNVGEQGSTLSGGQKQRIAIARAIIKDPKILLLDEATSALDTNSEKVVMNALDNARKNRTTVVVAHRLSTVRNADVIAFVKQGEIAELGTHDQLLDLRGLYHTAVQAQALLSADGLVSVDTSAALALSATEKTSIPLSGTVDEKFDPEEHVGIPLKFVESDKDMAARIRSPFRTIMVDVRDCWSEIIVGFMSSMVTGGVSPVFGVLYARIIIIMIQRPRNEISPGPLSGANFYAFMHVVLAITAFFSMWGAVFFLGRAAAKTTFKYRNQMFDALTRQEIAYYDEETHSVGSLSARLATEPNEVGQLLSDSLKGFGQFIGTIIAGFTILFLFSWELTLFLLALIPMVVIGQFYETSRQNGEGNDKIAEAHSRTAQVVTEVIKEIRTVTSLGKQQYFIDLFNDIVRGPYRFAQKQALLSSVAFSFSHSYRMFSSAVGLYVGSRLLDSGRLTFVNMFAVMMTFTMTGSQIGRSSALFSQFSQSRRSAAKVIALLNREPLISVDQPGATPSTITGSFDMENVAFTYPTRPSRPIFDGHFSLRGEANKTIALVGPSGCGKSTVIGMLERWYDPSAGIVSVDNVRVDQYNVANLRSHLALVGQEPVLFDMTIRENLIWGTDRQVSEQELDDVTQRANAYNFIKTLSNGYDTRVGDKGSQLSGGQKQRIAIARALIRRPRILLLDEATSALDSESEAVVQAALDEAASGQTTVTIAHRLSTIQNSDLIAVIDGGRVIEQGTHAQLLAKGGLYTELASLQS
ncbi:hypothetical protein JAAARDRAFT_37231 [Jaapia argillacea MUCL 33604]|uniref:Uncharacterized protein n=1 Tax=Jaapia argillacea MUCL 33604 TaxID=933084 RepID=A0A067PLM9_9AGAM|nr:hypothetical protein JAAARDRAFT_37231 [Jaapia argillacea MUCL 33604]